MVHRTIQIGLIALMLSLTAALTRPAWADSYKLDPEHAAVVFSIQHMQFSYTYGWFNHVEGNFSTGQTHSFKLTIKTDSINTNSEKRDEHLRGPDFFNAKQFPVITFVSTSVQAHSDILTITGDLTLHGTTKSITAELKKIGEGKDPMGNYRAGYATSFTIKRSDFGMNNALDMVGDEVRLMISFEGIRE